METMRAAFACIALAGCTLPFDPDLLDEHPFDCTGIPFEAPVLEAAPSSPLQDESPSLSRNGLALYFSSNRDGGVGGTDLYVATRADRASSFGEALNLTALNTAESESSPSISANGLRLYYVARPAAGGPNVLQVAERARVDDPFEPATPIQIAQSNPAGPDISFDELSLYFHLADGELWVMTRDAVGEPWGPATTVDGANTIERDLAPSIDAYGTTIYFHSSLTDASTDILAATRQEPGGPFGAATVVPHVSTLGVGEYDPDVSYDDTSLATALNRGGVGQKDIWLSTRQCPTSN
jgi:hypothetical protein